MKAPLEKCIQFGITLNQSAIRYEPKNRYSFGYLTANFLKS